MVPQGERRKSNKPPPGLHAPCRTKAKDRSWIRTGHRLREPVCACRADERGARRAAFDASTDPGREEAARSRQGARKGSLRRVPAARGSAGRDGPREGREPGAAQQRPGFQ